MAVGETEKWLRSGALDVLPGLVLLVTLALGAAGVLTAVELPKGQASMRTGAWATAVEEHIDAEVPWRQPSVEAWGIAEFVVYGNGREGVVVGRDGWLFTAEEFVTPPDGAARQAAKVELVAAVHRHLAERGTRLVVAVIPAKARIHPEHLRTRWPREAGSRYSAFLDALEARGVDAPDVGVTMALAARDKPVYNKTDTHWTPHGAEVVARALARHVAFPGQGAAEYRRVPGDPVVHDGDLRAFVPLGPMDALLPNETVQPFTSEGGPSGLGLFDEVRIPVALVGTSYSAQELWSFHHALRIHLGADVLDASSEGGGPVEPMLAYLGDPAFRDDPPELVIWEFPERYLATEDDLSEHAAVLTTLGLEASD